MSQNGQLNFVNGQWRRSMRHYLDVVNPATAAVMTTVPLSPGAEVDAAVQAAAAAFPPGGRPRSETASSISSSSRLYWKNTSTRLRP